MLHSLQRGMRFYLQDPRPAAQHQYTLETT
jgi:hypothetical protein